MSRVWKVVAAVFMGYVIVADFANNLRLNLVDRGGKWARQTGDDE